jgi:uncharacterized membrane protein
VIGSLYAWLLFIHLAGVFVFLLGHGYAGLAALGRSAATLRPQLVADRVAMPGLGVTVLSGIWLGFIDGAWGRGWIWAALAILVAISLLMGFWSLPYHRAREQQREPAGARPVTMTWTGGLALLLILFLMVFKPF